MNISNRYTSKFNLRILPFCAANCLHENMAAFRAGTTIYGIGAGGKARKLLVKTHEMIRQAVRLEHGAGIRKKEWLENVVGMNKQRMAFNLF